MEHAKERHPLDDDEIFVTVSLMHAPTRTQSVGMALAMEGEPLQDAFDEATHQAADRLLEQLEVRGG